MNMMDLMPCIHCGDISHSASMHEQMGIPVTPSSVPIKGTVSVEDAVRTNEEAADFGAYSTFAVNITDAPIRILSYDKYRSRVVISVDGTTNSVWIGKKEQINASLGAQGFLVTSSKSLVIENKQEVWMAPNGVVCNVSVLNERWEST